MEARLCERCRERSTIFSAYPLLGFSRVGDHKVIWELNRHQHLILLGQAYTLTGVTDYASEISRQLESWIEANPFQEGINWTGALEVAIRTLSWICVLHLAGDQLGDALRARIGTELYRHGLYVADNLFTETRTFLAGGGASRAGITLSR